MREKSLDARLAAIVSLIKSGESVADIGSDHAYIPLHLIKNNICTDVLVTDIKKGPLEAARKNFCRFGYGDMLVTMQYDGISSDVPDKYSTIIVAGMGGLTVCGIIERAAEPLIKHKNKLILQPMTEQEALRKYLIQNGFEITREIITKTENEKLYNIIEARAGTAEKYTEPEYRFGKLSLCKEKRLYCELLRKHLMSLYKAKEKGATDKDEAIETVKKYLTEAEECLQ